MRQRQHVHVVLLDQHLPEDVRELQQHVLPVRLTLRGTGPNQSRHGQQQLHAPVPHEVRYSVRERRATYLQRKPQLHVRHEPSALYTVMRTLHAARVPRNIADEAQLHLPCGQHVHHSEQRWPLPARLLQPMDLACVV